MDDALGVQVSNSNCHLGSIEQNLALLESLLTLENFVKFSTSNEWHDKVKSKVVLEKIVHTDQEWMITLEHDIFFENCVIYLIVLNKDIFTNGLNCV